MSYLKELGKPDDVVNEKDFVIKNVKLSPYVMIKLILCKTKKMNHSTTPL